MGKLRNKIAFSFVIVALILSALISSSLYVYTRRQARENTRARLMDIANTASQLIDVDVHSTLTEPEHMDSHDYLTIRYELDSLLLNNPNILYAYTMRSLDGEVIFVVDSIVGEGEPADLAEVYDEAEPVFSDYVATADEPWADEDFTTDEWGTVLSGYAPLITSDGNLDGIIGIDMDVADVRAIENQFLWISLGVFLISCPFVILAGWLVGNRLSAPLNTLKNDVQRMASGDLDHRANITSKDEFAELARSFNFMTSQVQILVDELEDRVEQRTSELEKRTRYLEATTNVSQAAAGILDVDELINKVVEEIRSQFQLYYVGLFITDDNHEWAVLRSGTGDAGRTMVSRGHRIKVGCGMIGWSIANNQPRVAQSAKDDEIRLVTAELPHTQSEAALPLRSRGRVLGAISVQSEQLGAFDEQTIKVLQTMADQVAMALDNAMLFTQSQKALEAELRALGQIGREGWQRFFQDNPEIGYKFFVNHLTSVDGEWDTSMMEAAHSGRSIEDDFGNLTIPIKIRNEVIGVIRFNKGRTPGSPDTSFHPSWTSEEINTLEILLDQVGQAIESARLYEDAERRATRERLTGEITAKVRSSNDPQTIMQTAVRELRRALHASRAKVSVQSEPIANQNAPEPVQEQLTIKEAGNGKSGNNE